VPELGAVPDVRAQFAAIARVRWQLFVNSLRTLRGRLELVSHIFITIGFATGGIGGFAACAGGAWYVISHGKSEWLALVLWLIFLFWQLFPVVATAFTENFDTSNLLRFPLSYSSFFLIRVAYGSLEPATLLGSLWLAGVVIGIALATPGLFLWSAFVLLSFAGVNILLARMIFSWVERWLAQRRTREILGVVFLFFIISFQLIGPLMGRYGSAAHPQAERFAQTLLPFQRFLPPGSAAFAISAAANGNLKLAAEGLGILAIYGAAIFWLLNLRLRAQFRGENLSEAAAPEESKRARAAGRIGWNLPGVSGAVAAVFEKEIRYLSRSGPMLFTLIMPVFILFIFRLSPSAPDRHSASFLGRSSDMAFPIGAAYALLILTNLVYNNFGPEGAGVQTYFTAPVPIRSVMLAKNLAHSAILIFEIILVWIGASLLFQPPNAGIVLATLAGMAFALPVNLAAGDLLSLAAPKRIDYGTFGRQRASNTTVFASFGVQIVVVGIAALTLITARIFGNIWLASAVFLLLAAVAWTVYFLVLNKVGPMALEKREEIIAELTRAS
jgi:ABC-2 type transport system permease protein